MKIRTGIPFLIISFLFSSSFSLVCLAQDQNAGGSEASIAEKIDTGDSPIVMEKRTGKVGGSVVTRTELNDENRVGFYLQNASSKAIRAYSLLLVNKDSKSVRIALYPGIPVAGGEYFRDSYLLSESDSPEWTFDWVLFADGSTWGPDKYKRSNEVLSFSKGREAAIAYAEEFVGPGETLPAIHHLKGNTYRQWAINIPNRVKDGHADHFKKGYDSVIEIFTNAPRLGNEAGRSAAIVDHLKAIAERSLR
jgi:hypothetical protein